MNYRSVLAGIASFAIAAPVGYALAQDGPRNVGDQPVAAEPVPVAPPATSQHPEAETFLVKPDPELVATCDQRLKVAPDDAGCRTVALLAAGDLNPGAYTNAEFDRAVSQATAPSDR